MESQLLGALKMEITAVAAKIKAVYDRRISSKRLNGSGVVNTMGLDFTMTKQYMRHTAAAAIPQNVNRGQKDNALKRLRSSVEMTSKNPHTTEAAINDLRAQR